MATISRYGTGTGQARGRAPAPLPPDPSCQPCPDCGGLECLCRPRYFAGQLLSERDLNRLDRYITEKHKLHNRHLWGSGVVCGLEVTCAPCDSGYVSVASGYALSPCGEDIVVCKPDMVDICALIARCRNDSEPDCAPYRGQESCGDVIESWVLAVRYAESPSRGITALTGTGQGCGCSCGGTCSGAGKGAGGCGCGGSGGGHGGCGCGGSGGGHGGCGCGGGHGGGHSGGHGACGCGSAPAQGLAESERLNQPRLNRGAPPSCEATLTCETYRYDVFREPEPETDDDDRERTGLSGVFAQLEGEMMARIACCLKQLEASLPRVPGDISQPIPANMQNAWFQWGCQMRTALANYLVRTGGHDCEAMAKLGAIVVPSPSEDAAAFQQAMQIATVLFVLLIFEAMIACICSNALPPCPPPKDPRVPLAVVKVRRRDCRVISVCNWHPLRKHVLTFPTLAYWFGFIPIARILREAMHRMCCDLFGLRELFQGFGVQRDNRDLQVAPARAAFSTKNGLPLDPLAGLRFDTALFEAVASRQAVSGGTATWDDLARAALGRDRVSIDGGLTGAERAAAIRRLGDTGPLSILAGVFASVTPVVARREGRGAEAEESAGGTDVSGDIAALKRTLARQAREITALKAAIKR